jgi:uncharacterized phage-associated protein
MSHFVQPHPPCLDQRSESILLAVLDAAGRAGEFLTQTKLVKLLYVLDLRQHERGEAPLTTIEWKWLDHGPFHNAIYATQRKLIERDVIRPEERQWATKTGIQLRLVDGNYPHPPEEVYELIESTVLEFKSYSATRIKNYTYQTAPMIEAQTKGRGVVLNMDLARPLPDIRRRMSQFSALIKSLPDEAHDNTAAQDELVSVIEWSRNSRKRANGVILGA